MTTPRRRNRNQQQIQEDLLKMYRDSGFAPYVEQVATSFLARFMEPSRIKEAYHIVGIEEGDSPELMEAVFKTKLKFMHPDTKTGSEAAFRRLHDAYVMLKEIEA